LYTHNRRAVYADIPKRRSVCRFPGGLLRRSNGKPTPADRTAAFRVRPARSGKIAPQRRRTPDGVGDVFTHASQFPVLRFRFGCARHFCAARARPTRHSRATWGRGRVTCAGEERAEPSSRQLHKTVCTVFTTGGGGGGYRFGRFGVPANRSIRRLSGDNTPQNGVRGIGEQSIRRHGKPQRTDLSCSNTVDGVFTKVPA
jgi:hypothetical protein